MCASIAMVLLGGSPARPVAWVLPAVPTRTLGRTAAFPSSLRLTNRCANASALMAAGLVSADDEACCIPVPTTTTATTTAATAETTVTRSHDPASTTVVTSRFWTAERRKKVIMVVVFLTCTVYQIYAGLRVATHEESHDTTTTTPPPHQQWLVLLQIILPGLIRMMMKVDDYER